MPVLIGHEPLPRFASIGQNWCLEDLLLTSTDWQFRDRPVCRGIASQSTLEVGLQGTNFDQCLQSEEEVRDQLKQAWPTFSAEDKRHCVALAKTGGESS